MANKYNHERPYPRNDEMYDCPHVTRGYRQNGNAITGTGKDQVAQNPPSDKTFSLGYGHCNKDHESCNSNENQCEYLKHPLATHRALVQNKPPANNSHQCQVLVNTPRYYKQKVQRHPSALCIPLLTKPESEIHLKTRSRTKLTDEKAVGAKHRRSKHRALNKQHYNEATRRQATMEEDPPSSDHGSSDEDDLRSVSLRAYSSGCLTVDISNQVGDLVRAFDTVSKRHKVKKIVYEEIEPTYQKCELEQLKPKKKRSQRKLRKNQLKVLGGSEYCDTDQLVLPEDDEDPKKNQCTCNNKGDTEMKKDPDNVETKDVNRLEKLFLEVFAQGKADGLSKQKKLDCLRDVYNQYSATLEFSNTESIDNSDKNKPPQLAKQFSDMLQTNLTQSESEQCKEENEFLSSQAQNFKSPRTHRHAEERGEGYEFHKGTERYNSSSDEMDLYNKNEPITKTNPQLMHCTCNRKNNSSYLTHSPKQEQRIKENDDVLPYMQTNGNDRRELFYNTTESNFETATFQEMAENKIHSTQKHVDHIEQKNNTECSSKCLKKMNPKFHNKAQTSYDGTNHKEEQCIRPGSCFVELPMNHDELSKNSHIQNEEMKGFKIPPTEPCPAPPKLSVSDDHFLSDYRHHHCGHLQCYQRSKSKGVEMANMEKRQTLLNKMKEGQNYEIHDDSMHNTESPIIYNDFPSEVPDTNRFNVQIEGRNIEPRKPANYGAENMSPSGRETPRNLTRSIEHLSSGRSNKTSPETENIDLNPFLNYLLHNNSSYNTPNIIPEQQNVYFCNVSHNVQQQMNDMQQESFNECETQNANTREQEITPDCYNDSNASAFSNVDPIIADCQMDSTHPVYQMEGIDFNHFGNMNSQNNEAQNCYSMNSNAIDEYRCIQDKLKNDASNRSLGATSRRNQNFKMSDCSDEQMSKAYSDQSSYKNYIESIIDNSTELLAKNQGVSTPVQHQGSKCQTGITKLEAETGTDFNMDDSSSQIDSRLSQEITQRLNDRLVQSEKGISTDNLVTLDVPEYLQHLKKLRWDHLRHISREVHRLENLERFLDRCGCGHMMINRGLT